jgi:hypothetical protein
LAQGNTPYGGEYGSDYARLPSNVCKPENAIPEMYQTHVSFIRGNVYQSANGWGYDQFTYGSAYEKPWFPDNSAFYGKNCYEFITAHLGYRLVLRESKLSQAPQAGGTLELQGKIENTGFANVLHNPNAKVLLVNGGAVYACDVSLNAWNLQSCKTYDYHFSLALPNSLAAGSYDVYLQLHGGRGDFFARAGSGIQFANAGGIYHQKLGANKLGTVAVAASGQVASAANDAFLQTNAPRAGAQGAQGAPGLLGHGFGAAGTISLSFNAGDPLTLAPQDSFAQDANATWQWTKDGANIGTQKELQIAALTAADAGAYQLNVTATLESAGVTATTSQSTATVNLSITDHHFSDYTTTVQPACNSCGKAARTCQDAGCALVETKALPPLEHVPGAPTTTPGDCKTRSRQTVACTLCGQAISSQVFDYGEHKYQLTMTGTRVRGKCAVCGDAFDKDYGGEIPNGRQEFAEPPKPYKNGPLVLVGADGYTDSYVPVDDSHNITFLFRMTGVQTPITLAKFRTISYTRDNYNPNADSNDNANYYGPCAYPVKSDGLWAFTISAQIMSIGNSPYFGGLKWAAFSDPASAKGTASPANDNSDSQFALLGIYDGVLAYDVLYLDDAGKFLERHAGEYNAVDNVWDNLIAKVEDVDGLYKGAVPTKPSDGKNVYVFDGWVDAAGNPIGALPPLANVIAYPSFRAQADPDAAAVAKAKAALTWDSIRNTNVRQDQVTSDLVNPLPLAGAAGTAIAWDSGAAAVTAAGIVARPPAGSPNAPATLTATVTKGKACDTVVFELIVLAKESEPHALVL